MSEGKIEGEIIGIKKGKIKVAKSLLKMKFSVDDIVKATGIKRSCWQTLTRK